MTVINGREDVGIELISTEDAKMLMDDGTISPMATVENNMRVTNKACILLAERLNDAVVLCQFDSHNDADVIGVWAKPELKHEIFDFVESMDGADIDSVSPSQRDISPIHIEGAESWLDGDKALSCRFD